MTDFSVEELRTTYGGNPELGRGTSLPSEARFVSSAVRVVERRLSRVQSNPDPAGLAVFFLHPAELSADLVRDSTHVPFLDQAQEQLTDRIWFTNEGINSARYVPMVTTIDADLIAQLISTGLGDLPAIVLDDRGQHGEIRFYPSGLHHLDEVRLFPLGQPVITWGDVEAEITRLVDGMLATPQRQINSVSTWAKASVGHAANNAEAVIQAIIRTGLYTRYPACRIEKEGVVDDGRFDLAISYLDPATSSKTNIGILELKVLRHKNVNGSLVAASINSDAVVDGYDQIESYAATESPTWAALCCFDLRSASNASSSCLDPVRGQASTNSIELGHWRLYWSSEALRRARRAA